MRKVTAFDAGLTSAFTEISATPGTHRQIYGKLTSFTSMSSGNLVGVRGEVTVAPSCAVSGSSFIYGTQGKLILGASAELDIGSAHACGVYGQLDISAGTCTAGHIACIIASIQDSSNTARAVVDGIYVECPQYGSGGEVNSVLKGFGSVAVGIDLGDTNMTSLFSVPEVASGYTCFSEGAPGAADEKILITVGGVSHYLAVSSSSS